MLSGGSAWESNPPPTPQPAPDNGFEVRSGATRAGLGNRQTPIETGGFGQSARNASAQKRGPKQASLCQECAKFGRRSLLPVALAALLALAAGILHAAPASPTAGPRKSSTALLVGHAGAECCVADGRPQ